MSSASLAEASLSKGQGLKSPVRFGLVGTGSIADHHARALALVDEAQLVAAHSRRAEAGRAFASEHGCAYEPTLEALLARPDVDAVAIATPSGTHAEVGIAAARAGKHVLCEKPLDITVERIDALLEAARSHQVLVGSILPARFGAGAVAARRAVEEGRLGRLSQCSAFIPWHRTPEYYAAAAWRGTWSLDGGGALMNQGIHAVDLLLWLAGEVSEVSARCQTRSHAIEVEDNAVAWLRFSHGGLGLVQASTVCYPGESRRIELKGDRGSVTLVDDRPTLWQFDTERPEDQEVRELARTSSIGGGNADPRAIGLEGHRLQYQDFARALIEGRPPIAPGSEGRRAVELIRAIYQSSRENRVVTLR